MSAFKLLALLCVLAASVHAEPLRVETITLPRPTSDEVPAIAMPLVISSNTTVAARINHALYLEFLELPAPQSPQQPLALVAAPLVQKLRFDVTRNDGRLLTVALQAETCSLDCEQQTLLRNFDAGTGRALELPDLLSEEGAALMAKRLLRERQDRYGARLAKLRAEPSTETNESRAVFFLQCLGNALEQHERHEADPFEGLRSSRLDLSSPQVLRLVGERCSPLIDREWDDVGEVSLEVPYAELAGRMTDYGRALLLGAPATRSASSLPVQPFGQVLQGTVGDRPVTLWLSRPQADGAVRGIYFHDDLRKPLMLSGMVDKDGVELMETADYEQLASFALQVGDRSLSGDWQARARSRQGAPPKGLAPSLPVRLNAAP